MAIDCCSEDDILKRLASKRQRGQVGIEYLILFSFVLLTLLPVIATLYNYSSHSQERLAVEQAEQTAKRIADAANTVYSLGYPSQIIRQVYVPSKIVTATVSKREIVFTVQGSSGNVEVVESTMVEVSGTLPTVQGTYRMNVSTTAEGDVIIDYVR